jgi:hypothetical protein
MVGLTNDNSINQIRSFEHIDKPIVHENSIHSAHPSQKSSSKIGKRNFKHRGMSGVPGMNHGLNANNLS